MKTLLVLVLLLMDTRAIAQLSADARQSDNTPTARLADANNRFALDLYQQTRDIPGNLAVSPYSIFSALAMTYAGARGQTETEVARVLHLPFGQDSTHAAASTLRTALLEAGSAAGCTLSVANRLWGQKDFSYLEAFLKTTRELYGAEAQALDFHGDPEGSRRRINDWTAAQTGRKILDLLPAGTITSLTNLILTSAIYFKANWSSPFKYELSYDGYFRIDATSKVIVRMMTRHGTYGYLQGDDFQMAVLNYAGSRASMVILLPDSVAGFPALESRLDERSLSRWLSMIQDREVSMLLPRFHATSSTPLVKALSAMGMASAFRAPDADFSGMDGLRGPFLSAVIHKTFVDVAEKGTEAAAAVAVMKTIGAGDGVPLPVVDFTADHPFLFIIRDEATGCILFVGRVMNPLL
jgi:serpin B